eukprot:gb/GEZN01009467.1/.p1 GENE.gb/GEZN01009467.1/~~gb/GEZN01009467.1/.p1  ORF type:complete len:299 (-),score=51.16 gb/GEZN01009467.1/:392-1288(-)
MSGSPKYHRIASIHYQGKVLKLKIRPPANSQDILEAICNRFHLPLTAPLILTDIEDGTDVCIDDTLETAEYELTLSQAASSKKRVALLIIDVQNDFMPPKGSLAVGGGLDIIPIINKLRKSVAWDHIALTQDWHVKDHVSFHSNNNGSTLFQPHKLPSGEMQVMWPDHCVQGSQGAEFHKDLVVEKTDSVVKKGMKQHVDSYSGFFDNDKKTKSSLSDDLKKHGITDVFCVGVAYDYCVGSSALDAVSEGFSVYMVEDAVRGVAPDSTKAMRESLIKHKVQLIESKDVPSIVQKVRGQ